MAESNFNHELQGLHDAIRRMRHHASRARSQLRAVKRNAFLAAKHYQELQRFHHNQLVDHLQQYKDYVTAKDPVAAFIEDSFGALRTIGEDPYDLLKLVAEGCKLKKYLAGAPTIVLADDHAARAGSLFKIAVDRSTHEAVSPEEECKLLRTQIDALKEQVRGLERTVALRDREIKRLNRLLARSAVLI